MRANTRSDVVQVAAKLFSDNGYHGTSMQHVADGLGILRGSIYAHINSKEDLLFEIVHSGADRFMERVLEIAQSTGAPEEKLRAAVKAHVETVAEHIEASTVFLNDWRFLSASRRRRIQAKRDDYEALFRQIIKEGVESGAYRSDLDTKFAAMLVLSVVNWVYQWYDSGGPMEPAQIAGRFSEMILDGFRPKRSKR